MSCDTRNSVGIWLQKERTSDIDKFSLNLMCLSACIGNECMGNGIVITMTKQPMYDIFAPRETKKSNTTKWTKRKDNVAHRLNHIAEILTELKHRLLSQQTEYVKPIQSKFSNLMKILDVFRLFHAGVPINNNVIAKEIQIKPNISNVIAKILLNIGNSSNKVPISILSSKLSAINFNLQQKNRFAAEHRMKKRSVNKWSGDTLKVKKLTLLDEANFKSNPLSKENTVHHFTGKLTVEHLFVKRLEKVVKEVTIRTKRSESIPRLEHRRIVVASINSVPWDDFMNTTYRKGFNTVINGLFLN